MYEAQVEQCVWEHPELFGVDKWVARQYRVASGIIDLLGISKEHMVIAEIKAGAINSAALAQVCRYATDIQYIVSDIKSKIEHDIFFSRPDWKELPNVDFQEHLALYNEWLMDDENEEPRKIVIGKQWRGERVRYEAQSLNVELYMFEFRDRVFYFEKWWHDWSAIWGERSEKMDDCKVDPIFSEIEQILYRQTIIVKAEHIANGRRFNKNPFVTYEIARSKL